MNFNLDTMTNYGFSFYDDELNENDLKKLAEDTTTGHNIQMPTVIAVSFVDLSVEADVVQDICEPAPMEAESRDISPLSAESSTSSYKDQVLMVIEQYNAEQQSRSPSPASSEASTTSLSDGSDSVTDEDKVTDKAKKTRGRKITLPRGEVIPGEFFCKLCKKNFKSRRGLKQHTNAHHTGIKAHGCEICGKRFDLLDEMKKHRERHSTENKPFGCRVDGCPKRFMYEFDMERHLAVRHGKAPFSCDICSKVFGRKDHLEKHTMSHKFNTVKRIKN